MRAITDAAHLGARQGPTMSNNAPKQRAGRAPGPTTNVSADRGLKFLVICLCLAGATLAGSTDVHAAAAAASTTRASAPVRIHVTVSSPTHKPKVNVPWPVKITVTNENHMPVAATVTMQVLFSGQPVGKIDNGATYRFVGTWQERKGHEITWPAASKGEPLTLQFTVKAQGITVSKTWAITVS
jgi:hypothetical protein